MGVLFTIAALIFVFSGLLSVLGVTDAGLNFISQINIHMLPILNTFPKAWVYVGLGLVFMGIARLLIRD